MKWDFLNIMKTIKLKLPTSYPLEMGVSVTYCHVDDT